MTTLTKDAIKKSFMKLLNRKSLGKITVKEIVEDCGINRNSFYYHYSDIPSLLEEILMEQADALVELGYENRSLCDCLLTSVDFALQNKTAMMHVYNSVNKEMFDLYLNRVAQYAVRGYIEPLADKYGVCDRDREAVITYYKSLLIGFVVGWLSGGMKYDLTDNIKRLCELFEGSTETALGRCEKSE